MAIEPKRGCGYRKVGGLYLRGAGFGHGCDMFPYKLHVCPVCSQGIKFSQGFTWVDPSKLWNVEKCPQLVKRGKFQITSQDGVPPPSLPTEWLCKLGGFCPFKTENKAGLMWVGKRFYSPESFIREANELGVCKRIANIPRNFKVGETWVFLAHKKAGTEEVQVEKDGATTTEYKEVPALFYAFRPTHVEMIVTQTQSQDQDFMSELTKKGITPVVVPDDDEDHQGSVYDTKNEPKEEVTDGQPTENE